MIGRRLLGHTKRGVRLDRLLGCASGAGKGAPRDSACDSLGDACLLQALRRRFPDAVACDPAAYETDLAEAWAVLRRVLPTLHLYLMAVARRVVVFAAADADSFATPEAPGAVFLNPGPGAGAVFFVEELVHQGGHHVFHALTAEWERLLTVDRDMPFGTLSGESDDHRSVEVVLHGVFTQSLMCVALYACLEAEVFEGSRHRELLGRLSFAMKRLHLDLVDVRRRDLYTEAGEDLVIGFEEAFDEVFSRAGRLITGFDLTNQPYSFSYGCFAALNA